MVRTPIPRLFALIGDPVAGNPTQEVVEDAFRRMGLDWRYISARVSPEALAPAVDGLRALGFHGAHVTVPHKVAVVRLVDVLSPAARAIGAVNCIVADDGVLRGENTDGVGLVAAVTRMKPVEGAHVLLFGAGGAARAIAVELAMAGAHDIRVANRDPKRRDHLVRAVEAIGGTVRGVSWPDRRIDIDGATIVVNATTIGMQAGTAGDAAVPVAWETARPGLIAADVVIERSTRFTAEAVAAGAIAIGGIEMLVEQAARSIELWTGRDPDREPLRRVLDAELTPPGGDRR